MRAWSRKQNPHFLSKITLFLAAIFALGILDFVLEFPTRPYGHMIFEIIFLLVAFGGAVFLAWGWNEARQELQGTRSVLSDQSQERDAWRKRARKCQAGVGEAIDEQMEDWKLTGAEKTITLFLLKGYSHKEIAKLCERSERTVRQHSVDVYRKAGVSGRAELAAFFLEDLLAPMDELKSS